MSKGFDLGQARRIVGPDLGPKYCKSYQQTTLGEKELNDILLKNA